MPTTAYENALTTVAWPFEDHVPAIRCPLTGLVVALGFGPDQDPDQDTPLTPADGDCPTLLFRYLYETGMEFIRPELAERIERKKTELVDQGEFEDPEDIDDLEVISEHLEDVGESLMVIDVPMRDLPGDGVVIGLDLARAITTG